MPHSSNTQTLQSVAMVDVLEYERMKNRGREKRSGVDAARRV